MKKKLISMLLVCAMAAGALAGCGGSSGGSSGGGAGTGTEKAADAGNPEGGKRYHQNCCVFRLCGL
ncbi:MAG: hypothetical protein ACLRZZ_00095 [Enterocloster sp.]